MAHWLVKVAVYAAKEVASPTLTKIGESLGELLAAKVNPNYSGLVQEDDGDDSSAESSE